MPRIVLRPRASLDLAEIWAFIAEDSIKHADKFAALIDDRFRALARRPYIGRSRPELAPDLRSLPVGQYVIFYLPLPKGVEIVRARHRINPAGGGLAPTFAYALSASLSSERKTFSSLS